MNIDVTPEHAAKVQRYKEAALRLEPRGADRSALTETDLELIDQLLAERGTVVYGLDDRHIDLVAHRFALALLAEVHRLRTAYEELGTEASDQCKAAAARTVHAEKERDRFAALADKLADVVLALTVRPRPPARADDRIRALRKLTGSQNGTQQ